MIIVFKNFVVVVVPLIVIIRIEHHSLAALIEIHIGNHHHHVPVASRIFIVVCQRAIDGQSKAFVTLAITAVNCGRTGYLFTGYIVNAFESTELAALATIIIIRIISIVPILVIGSSIGIFDGFGSLATKRCRLLMNSVSRTPFERVY